MTSRPITRTLAGVIAVAMAVLIAAQPGQAQQPQPQGQQDVPEISDDELETFTEAYIEIDQIRGEMQAEMQTAQDQATANEIQQQANQEMSSVLEDHGFTVEEYQQITQILNVDPDQRQEFQALLDEKLGEEDPPEGAR